MLQVKNISLTYNDLPVIKDISFSIDKNEIVVIIGPSGCGKSSLLKMIANRIQPSSGQIINTYNKTSFVFQDDCLLPWYSVYNNIKIVEDIEDKEKINQLIEDVELKGFEDYLPKQLSGGMKKRCGIARAFYYQSDILLMDEPFSGLDYSLRKEMIDMLLKMYHKNKKPIIFVTHEIDEALYVADRIIVLSQRPSSIIKEFVLPKDKNKESMNTIKEELITYL